jgi:hypothetical protein
MTASRVSQSDSLDQLRREIESFLASLDRPLLLEEGTELFDLSEAHWRVTLEFGKLILQVWTSSRSITRRIEELAYRDHGRLGLFARRQGARQSSTLELRDARPSSGLRAGAEAPEGTSRHRFRQELLAMLGREFSGWRIERVSNRSDREHSFSAWYTRGWARRGSTAWAFLGLGEAEALAASDAVLAFALIWLDWLRQQATRASGVSVTGLKLFLPRAAVEVAAHRAAYLDPRTVSLEVWEWSSAQKSPVRIDLKDYGNVETRLSPHFAGSALFERHRDLLNRVLGFTNRLNAAGNSVLPAGQNAASAEWAGSWAGGDRTPRAAPGPPVEDSGSDPALRATTCINGVDVVPDVAGNSLSLRVRGLEVARIEGELAPRVYFGLEGDWRRLEGHDLRPIHNFLIRVVKLRRAGSEDPTHQLYRLQSERWLESLLVRDLTKIDSALLPDFVYPQVPAFTGAARAGTATSPDAWPGFPECREPDAPALSAESRMTRGVIDILAVARGQASGYRLAVLELKVEEKINLPLQGLDYWLRVKWLQERGQFKEFGYFPGIELSPEPPLLYFVSPAFRFHSTTAPLVRYLSPKVEVILVGLKEKWREGIDVLFRRELRGRLGA